eukprot:1091642-Amphidinium_carterae.1
MRVAGSVTPYNGAFADTLGPVENNLAVFVSLVGWLPESLMSALMEDSRLLKHFEAYQALTWEESAYIERLGEGVWLAA